MPALDSRSGPELHILNAAPQTRKVSAGEFARALANRIRIILADEPWRQFVAATAMLDGT
jgi:hypothetical protein